MVKFEFELTDDEAKMLLNVFENEKYRLLDAAAD